MSEKLFENITLFDYKDKEFYLRDIENSVDEGIKDVVYAINTIEDFVTMNSCQGGGHGLSEIIKLSGYEDLKEYIKGYDENHCPITYVDFYVLNYNHVLAERFFIYLKHRFEGDIVCKLEFENDYLINEDDEALATAFVDYRYGIQLPGGYNENLLEKLAKAITEFKETLIEGRS